MAITARILPTLSSRCIGWWWVGGWVGGWVLDFARLMLISTQVEVVVEVGVELGKIFLGCFLRHKNLQIPHYLNGSQSRNDSGYFMSSANKGNLFKRLEHEKRIARLVSQCAIPFFPWPSQVAISFDWASDVGWVTSLCKTNL